MEKKKAPRRLVNKESSEKPTTKELADAMKTAKLVAEGKRNGCIIVVEEFEENGSKGIKGMTYWHGLGVDVRAQVLSSSAGISREMLITLLMMHAGYKYD